MDLECLTIDFACSRISILAAVSDWKAVAMEIHFYFSSFSSTFQVSKAQLIAYNMQLENDLKLNLFHFLFHFPNIHLDSV